MIGINLTSLTATAERKNFSGNISVNSSPAIESVEKKDIEFSVIKDVLTVGFRFTTTYEPNVGEIAMEGELLYQNDKTKDILNRWKKERKLDDDVAAEIYNAIFRKCLTKTVDISQELRLPLPIQFPFVVPKDAVASKGK